MAADQLTIVGCEKAPHRHSRGSNRESSFLKIQRVLDSRFPRIKSEDGNDGRALVQMTVGELNGCLKELRL
jgi:hypothetical protein